MENQHLKIINKRLITVHQVNSKIYLILQIKMLIQPIQVINIIQICLTSLNLLLQLLLHYLVVNKILNQRHIFFLKMNYLMNLRQRFHLKWNKLIKDQKLNLKIIYLILKIKQYKYLNKKLNLLLIFHNYQSCLF